MCAKSLQLCPTLCDPMEALQPARLLCPWDFPGKNTGVGCHAMPSPDPGIKYASPALQVDVSLQGNPYICLHDENLKIAI